MSHVAGRPQPSKWAHRINGSADEIRGYDAGEAEQEMRSTPAAPYVMGDEIETLNEIDRLTKINNK